MNLDGVCGDARKRLESEAAAVQPFDQHPECLLCGRRSEHSHAPDPAYTPFSVPRLGWLAVPRD